MSRSYKKPYVKDKNKGAKTQANQCVRRAKDVPSGRQYTRVFSSWNISDWVFYVPGSKKASRK